MKKIMMCLCLASAGFAFGQEIKAEKVQMEVLFEFPYGQSEFELGLVYSPEGIATDQIMDLVVTEDSYLILDSGNQRLVEVSREFDSFSIHENRTHSVPGLLEVLDNYLLSVDKTGYYLQLYDLEKEEVAFEMNEFYSRESLFYRKNIDLYSFSLMNGVLIGETSDDSFVVLDLSDKKQLLEGQEALLFLKENGFELIDNTLLVEKGIYYTKSAGKLFRYIQKSNNKSLTEKLGRSQFDINAVYSGRDLDGNSYWTIFAGCYVFNSQGELIKHIVSPGRDASRSDMVRYSVDYQGNLYRLVRADEAFALKRIKRAW